MEEEDFAARKVGVKSEEDKVDFWSKEGKETTAIAIAIFGEESSEDKRNCATLLSSSRNLKIEFLIWGFDKIYHYTPKGTYNYNTHRLYFIFATLDLYNLASLLGFFKISVYTLSTSEKRKYLNP